MSFDIYRIVTNRGDFFGYIRIVMIKQSEVNVI